MRGAAAAYGNEVYDDYEDPAYVPSQRVSGRRKTPGVDFSKLTLAALRRYRQVFQLGDIPGGAKEDLLPAIQRHFAQQVVDEAEILIAFASRVRRQSLRQTSPLPASKKPRGVAKPLR